MALCSNRWSSDASLAGNKILLRSLGIPVDSIEQLWTDWQKERSPETALRELHRILDEGDIQWGPGMSFEERLEKNMYSPIQILLWLAASEADCAPEDDYPFLFSTMGYFIEDLMRTVYDKPQTRPDDDLVRSNRELYKTLMQTMFYGWFSKSRIWFINRFFSCTA